MGRTSKASALLLVTLTLMSLALLPSVVKAQTRTLIVPDQYPTITSAIASAADGDTILVKAGTYPEQQLIINKKIFIIGENQSTTKITLNPPYVEVDYPLNISNPSHYAWGIDISADNVEISGFTISGEHGNLLSMGAKTLLSNNNITLSSVHFEGSQQYIKKCIVTGGLSFGSFSSSSVLIDNLLYGVWDYGRNLRIEGNVFYNGAGIILWSTGCTIFRNSIVNCYDGVAFNSGSYNNKVYYNNFINNSYTVIYDQPREQIPWYNQWDNGTVGNFWDYYLTMYPNASEVDHTGIGNTPYVIDASNIDNYPLMAPANISSTFSNTLPIDVYLTTPNRAPQSTPTPIATPVPTVHATNSTLTPDLPRNAPRLDPIDYWIPVSAILAVGIVAILLYRRHRKTANQT